MGAGTATKTEIATPQKESDLYAPVRDWLQRKGYTVYVENFGVDVIGVKGEELVVVELKLCFSREVLSQCYNRATWADRVYAAVASNPRDTSLAAIHGFGVLRVSGGKVRQILGAKPQPWERVKRRRYRLKQLARRPAATSNCVAGLPACRQLREQRRAAAEISARND